MDSFILSEDRGLLLNVTPPNSTVELPQLNSLKGFSIMTDKRRTEYEKEDVVFINKNIYDIADYFSAECDVCGNEIDFLNNDSKWYFGEDYEETYCGQCKPELCWTSSEWWTEHFEDFGSLKDWVEIYETESREDDNGGCVLYNINAESKLCNTIAFSCYDNHGRVGFFTFPNLTNDDILQELSSYSSNPVTSFLENRNKYPYFG